jgi:hypothetical protein
MPGFDDDSAMINEALAALAAEWSGEYSPTLDDFDALARAIGE